MVEESEHSALSARELLKGHPYCEMKTQFVKPMLDKHIGERYEEKKLLFDLRGSLPRTLDIGSGGDHGQGAFSHTLSVLSQVGNQESCNQLFICKAQQKDGYADLLEMTGKYKPAFKALEVGGSNVANFDEPIGLRFSR